MHMKFEIDIPKQTWVTLPKPCCPETEKSNMATRQPFRKWGHWKSIGSYPYTWALCHWSLELIFKAKLKIETGNQNIQYGRQAAILKVTSLKINRLLPIYIKVLCHLSLELIFGAKLKLESGNKKIQYGRLAAILKLTLLKIDRLLHINTSIVPLKFGADIQGQTKVRV